MPESSVNSSRLCLHTVLELQSSCSFLGHTVLSTTQVLPIRSILVKSHVVLQAEDKQCTYSWLLVPALSSTSTMRCIKKTWELVIPMITQHQLQSNLWTGDQAGHFRLYVIIHNQFTVVKEMLTMCLEADFALVLFSNLDRLLCFILNSSFPQVL